MSSPNTPSTPGEPNPEAQAATEAEATEVELAEVEATEPEPTMLEQMGGISGLVASTLPIVVLVPVNNLFGLGPALAAALGVALLVCIWRLVRKENLQPAISGIIGVAIGAFIAWKTGDAKGYFLYGIWVSLVFAIISVISVILRWPIIGVVWKGLNGEGTEWREDKAARRAYSWATIAWAIVFGLRFYIQRGLYDADATNSLAITRIIMGWPLTALVTIFTIFMVRRAGHVLEEHETPHTPQDAEKPAHSSTTVAEELKENDPR